LSSASLLNNIGVSLRSPIYSILLIKDAAVHRIAPIAIDFLVKRPAPGRTEVVGLMRFCFF
jgi:hypothetical protein